MTKRHTYKGMYTRFGSKLQLPTVSSMTPQMSSITAYTHKAADCLWTIYTTMFGNYVAIVSVILILLISYLVPDMSHKRTATSELKNIKKALDKMSNEVKHAEAACLTVANEICCLQCSVQDDTTETEVTIMSYVYTDSFDGSTIPMTTTEMKPEHNRHPIETQLL